mmetsp:Transcript_2698/g.5346  ORF Transcript_2698/g.5346 Transcript_2698/m.5346 type:complete len:213 (-) Transcript_2698:1355-1993(-)
MTLQLRAPIVLLLQSERMQVFLDVRLVDARLVDVPPEILPLRSLVAENLLLTDVPHGVEHRLRLAAHGGERLGPLVALGANLARSLQLARVAVPHILVLALLPGHLCLDAALGTHAIPFVSLSLLVALLVPWQETFLGEIVDLGRVEGLVRSSVRVRFRVAGDVVTEALFYCAPCDLVLPIPNLHVVRIRVINGLRQEVGVERLVELRVVLG